ncbi:MAG: alpha/beta hydrolase [Pseudomonadota bacterium]
MADESSTDPMIAFLMENPPKDALEFRAILDGFALQLNANMPDIGESLDDVVIAEFEKQNLTVDIHKPKGEGPFPILIYFHGGGWIMGSPKTHRKLCFRFAEAGYLVFNVHYRLAPEYPFPAAFDDCLTALSWVQENAQQYDGDASRIAVGGDSAGGNLTAAVAASLSDAGNSPIKSILLIYPALDFANMDSEQGAIPGSDSNLVDMMVDSYIGHDYNKLVVDPRVSPIHVAEKLPEAHVMCGTADALIEDCQKLMGKLEAAGIPAESAFFDEMPHGFAQMEDFFPQAKESIERMIAFLNRTV